MAVDSRFNRRTFLQTAIAAAAAAGIGCGRSGTPWRFFKVDEARALAAMCDRIIPSDQDPGAAWAGVVNYIDRQLCGPLRRFRGTYREGVAAVEQTSRRLHSKVFADLDGPQQIGLLEHLEAGNVPGGIWQGASSSEFLALVIDHTMQGYYGDPRHGGNRDGVSWKMLALPYPPIRGRQRNDLTKL